MRTLCLILLLAGGSPTLFEDSEMPVKDRNRLATEKSPYLLQHAANPVDWYPWGDEAFERARKEDKPVFLSIGYATCHWCHVMERESFEDGEIAAFLNRRFISIKVDREERPDVDRIYMEYVIASTGHGGWPLSVWLTPDRDPFFGGTYFPPENKWGRKGFRTILEEISGLWENRREEVLRQGRAVTQKLREGAVLHRPGQLHPDLVKNAVDDFERMHDPRYGGFGGAPKFPQPAMARFLLRHHYRTENPGSLGMVLRQLDAMAAGGIYDHLGGGFARYATDDRWLVPHFEKMLYDNAQLLHLYSEAHRVKPSPLYEKVIRETAEYILRDMTLPEGGFASAEDADSEGVEGRFYVWRAEDVDRLLGEDAPLFRRVYDVTDGGNWEDPHHDTAGLNILNRIKGAEAPGRSDGRTPPAIEKVLDGCRMILLEARNRRTRPLRDDKILTSWNGLMIGALAHAGSTLQEPRYVEAARKAACFILDALQRNGILLRRHRDGDSAIEGLLEDHAFFVSGLLDLYDATLETEWLLRAREINEETVRHFYDGEKGGFFVTRNDRPDLITRMKDPTDGALPSAGNMAVLNLIRLGEITGDGELSARAETSLKGMAGAMAATPRAFPLLLTAVDRLVNPSRQIVLAGDPSSFLQTIHSRFMPDTTVLHVDAGETLAPMTRGKTAPPGHPTAWACTANTCSPPITDAANLP